MNPAPSKRGPTLAGLVGLREAGAPVRERLMSMLFLAGIAHGIIILGLSFSAGGSSGPAPGMQVLLVTEDLPEARSNERAIYLAQRTQLGSGNTRTLLTGGPLSHPAPRSSASSGNDESSSPESAAPGTPRTLATPAPAPLILWLGETGEGAAARRSAQMAKAEPESHGRGDARELVLRGDPKTGQWISPDTRASNLAPYLDAWRRKIERLGAARQRLPADRPGGIGHTAARQPLRALSPPPGPRLHHPALRLPVGIRQRGAGAGASDHRHKCPPGALRAAQRAPILDACRTATPLPIICWSPCPPWRTAISRRA